MKYFSLDGFRTTLIFLTVIVVLVVFFFIAIYMLSSHPLREPQPIHIPKDLLTLNFKTSVLRDAFEDKTLSWCTIKHHLPTGSTIDIISTNDDNGIFNNVFLTDSIAPKMANEYPDLFSYTENNGQKIFTLKVANADHVIMPAWLVKELIDRDVLKLPNNK